MGRAAETTIREKRHGFAETCADQCGGDTEHLTHAGTTFGAFVANNNNLASLNLPPGDGGHRLLFTIKHARWAALVQPLVSGHFDDTAFWGKIPFSG
jgi:hypothetical protein